MSLFNNLREYLKTGEAVKVDVDQIIRETLDVPTETAKAIYIAELAEASGLEQYEPPKFGLYDKIAIEYLGSNAEGRSSIDTMLKEKLGKDMPEIAKGLWMSFHPTCRPV